MPPQSSAFENRYQLGLATFVTSIMFLAVVLIIVPVAPYVYYMSGTGVSRCPEKWGQFGDYLGGTLNPLFAMLSVLAICITIVIQVKQFNEASRHQAVQKFESLLFELIRFHRENFRDMKFKYPSDKEDNSLGYFRYLAWKFRRAKFENVDSPNAVQEYVQATYGQEYEDESIKDQLGHYFRNLYHIFKLIDKTPALSMAERYQYAKIVRAQLSSIEVVMLAYNACSKEGANFKHLIAKYALLQELDPTELAGPLSDQSCLDEVFGPEAFQDKTETDFGAGE